MNNRLKDTYTKEVVPALIKQLGYKSAMQVPRLEKIIISVCSSEVVQNPKLVNGIVEEVNITTVKVRNFDNSIITIPPQTLVYDSFQNWIGMQKSDGRRVKRMVYFDFRSRRQSIGDREGFERSR